jgi:endonuclease G
MIEIPSLRPETRYGMPNADQLLFNRQYIIGYSYLFRQPRWAMELIDPTNKRVEINDRLNNFRTDFRIPEQFRADLDDYVGKFDGKTYDRGHLISSADRRATGIHNSETFLLSNMSPQMPEFNRGIWKKLEESVRSLANEYVEVYTICGPLFEVGEKILVIGKGDTKVPVPHGFFKSVLAEQEKGKLDLWTFAFSNKVMKGDLNDCLRTTTEVETWAGLPLWDRLRGKEVLELKNRKNSMWTIKKKKKVSKPVK